MRSRTFSNRHEIGGGDGSPVCTKNRPAHFSQELAVRGSNPRPERSHHHGTNPSSRRIAAAPLRGFTATRSRSASTTARLQPAGGGVGSSRDRRRPLGAGPPVARVGAAVRAGPRRPQPGLQAPHPLRLPGVPGGLRGERRARGRRPGAPAPGDRGWRAGHRLGGPARDRRTSAGAPNEACHLLHHPRRRSARPGLPPRGRGALRRRCLATPARGGGRRRHRADGARRELAAAAA